MRTAMKARQRRRKRRAESSWSLNSEAHRGKTEKRSEKARGEKRKGRRHRGEKCQNRAADCRKVVGARSRRMEERAKTRGR